MGTDDPASGIGGEKSNLAQAGLQGVCFFRSIRHANASMPPLISVNQCHQWFYKFFLDRLLAVLVRITQ